MKLIWEELNQHLTRETIIRVSDENKEKPFGYIFDYIKDVYPFVNRVERTELAVALCVKWGLQVFGGTRQVLKFKGYEYGEHEGLGLIHGNVRPISDVIPQGYKIPHIGWNYLKFKKESPLFKYINEGDYVYFVHSYYAADCDDSVIAVTEYGADLTAAAANGNVFGCQFHPEKSGPVGLSILKAFCEVSP